jgi:tripartite-type tricarboxylate transporter receptor subunit TctC
VRDQLRGRFQLIPNVIGQVKGGRLRALAVTSGKRPKSCRMCRRPRRPALPDMKRMVGSPCSRQRARPGPIIDRLHAAYTKAMADPAIRRRIVEVGAEPAVSTPSALREFMQAEAKKWGDIIRLNNIKPN